MAEKVIMSGNEAIARGAYEGGCVFASAYPGKIGRASCRERV